MKFKEQLSTSRLIIEKASTSRLIIEKASCKNIEKVFNLIYNNKL